MVVVRTNCKLGVYTVRFTVTGATREERISNYNDVFELISGCDCVQCTELIDYDD